MRSKRFFLGFALVALALALWYLGRSGAPAPVIAPAPAPELTVVPAEPPAQPTAVVPGKPATPEPPLAMKRDGLALWEIKIDEALRSNAETPAIAQMLLQQINGMPGEGQFASARHIVNLLPDKDYLTVLPYVQNTRLDPGFQEVIVAESLNRSDEVKLPVLLAAARTPNHPMAEIAKSTLGFLLENNFGDDWGRWEAAVKEALAKKENQ